MRAPVIVTSDMSIPAVLRADREAMGLSGEALDARVGWADRYSAKAENPHRDWGKRLIHIHPMGYFWLMALGRRLVIMDEDQAETLIRQHDASQGNNGVRQVRVMRTTFLPR